MTWTRKPKTIATLAAVALAGAGATVLTASAAGAESSDTCTAIYDTVANPAYVAAWDETVSEQVPAVGEPTIEEANPNYVPAYTVDHAASYQRWTWHITGQVAPGTTPDVTGSTPLNTPSEWRATTTDYAGAGNGNDPVGQPFQRGQGGGGAWYYWTGGPAWTETVPAQGDPTISVPNPAYKAPEVKETIVSHAAVGEPTIQVVVGEECATASPVAVSDVVDADPAGVSAEVLADENATAPDGPLAATGGEVAGSQAGAFAATAAALGALGIGAGFVARRAHVRASTDA
jgi:hypothetical protein